MPMIQSNFIASAPFFLVKDIPQAASYYQKVLGFTHETLWGDPPNFCIVERERMSIMLKLTSAPEKIVPNTQVVGGAWDAYFWVQNADLLFKEFDGKGAKFAYPLTIQAAYQMKEFAVEDLNGYILAFGQHHL